MWSCFAAQQQGKVDVERKIYIFFKLKDKEVFLSYFFVTRVRLRSQLMAVLRHNSSHDHYLSLACQNYIIGPKHKIQLNGTGFAGI